MAVPPAGALRKTAVPVVLADDLTGSADVGAECLRAGWRVGVAFPWGGKFANPDADEVRVVDIESRKMSPAGARRRAAETGRELRKRGLWPSFFKMDSTLRGNFLEEARSLLDTTGAPLAWLVPANPAQGRWTVEGKVFVNGEPLEQTSYARDPLHPVLTGDVAALAGRQCARLPLFVPGKPGEAARERAGWRGRGFRFAVADAISEDDLRTVAGAIPSSDLVFGAAPMARYLLGRPPRPFRGTPRLAGRWLGIIGSLNPLTSTQVKLASRIPGVSVTTVKPAALFGGAKLRPPRCAFMWLVALDAAAFRPFLRRNPSRASGQGGQAVLELGNRISVELGGLARRLAWEWLPSGLLLSGGLTAAGVCERMGIAGLELESELLPGLVASRARADRSLEIITKPGGFGAENAVAEIARKIGREG